MEVEAEVIRLVSYQSNFQDRAGVDGDGVDGRQGRGRKRGGRENCGRYVKEMGKMLSEIKFLKIQS